MRGFLCSRPLCLHRTLSFWLARVCGVRIAAWMGPSECRCIDATSITHARISPTLFTHHISTFPYSIFCSLFNHISSRPTSHTRHNPMFDQLNVEQVGIYETKVSSNYYYCLHADCRGNIVLSLEPIFYPQSSQFFFCFVQHRLCYEYRLSNYVQ